MKRVLAKSPVVLQGITGEQFVKLREQPMMYKRDLDELFEKGVEEGDNTVLRRGVGDVISLPTEVLRRSEMPYMFVKDNPFIEQETGHFVRGMDVFDVKLSEIVTLEGNENVRFTGIDTSAYPRVIKTGIKRDFAKEANKVTLGSILGQLKDFKSPLNSDHEVTVYDIETTGFSGAQNDLLSFAYLTLDGTFSKVLHKGVLYFYREGMEDPEANREAFAVHGLTKDFLKQFAGQYDTNMARMYKILSSSITIGHNNTKFDKPFIVNYTNKMNFLLPIQAFQYEWDTMVMWKKLIKGGHFNLAELPYRPAVGFTKESLQAMHKVLFSGMQVRSVDHDATFDVVKTFALFIAAVLKGGTANVPEFN